MAARRAPPGSSAPPPSLLRQLTRTAAADARADLAAGDAHLYELMGRLEGRGLLHRDAWICYRDAYAAARARLEERAPTDGGTAHPPGTAMTGDPR